MTRRVICHLIASNFAGGPEKQVIELSARLRSRGWDAVIGSFRENRSSVEVIESARERGLDTFLVETRSPFSPASIVQLARHLRRRNVDLLVTHGYKPDVVGYLATRGLPLIQLPMVRGYTGENRRVRCYEALDRWLLRRLAHVLCVSAATRRMLIRHGLRAGGIAVLHNAVDCDVAVAPLDLRREFGWPQGARVVVAAGRLSPEKGQRYLVDALRILADQDQEVCLAIFGAGPMASKLRAQCEELRLGGRIVLAGFRRPILPYLAGADLLVNPSVSEGLPNVVLEACAVRTPVVATDVGGVGEIIIPAHTGWLVPPRDAGALAAAIGEALQDRVRARVMAEESYRRVCASFSFSFQTTRFMELCEGALWEKSCGARAARHGTRVTPGRAPRSA